MKTLVERLSPLTPGAAGLYGGNPEHDRLCHLPGIAATAAGRVGFEQFILVFILMTLYFLCVMEDSAALTAGMVAASEPGRKGAAMALLRKFTPAR